jgi:hypothetical protein
MSGNDLDIPAQPAKLRTKRACKFKASIYKSQQSAKIIFPDRVCEPESLQKQDYVAARLHHVARSLLSDDRTAFRHTAFIAFASGNLSSTLGENAR